MKHCGTCKFWENEGTPDEGVCTETKTGIPTFKIPVGGMSTQAFIYTHAIFGCVNHKLSEEGE